MQRGIYSFGIITAVALSLVSGQAEDKKVAPRLDVEPRVTVGQEVTLESSYEFGAKTKVGRTRVGNADQNRQLISYVTTPQIDEDTNLRVGFEGSRTGLGGTDNIVSSPFFTVINPTPSSLLDAHLVLGGDIAVTDEWLVRAEILPGFYATSLDSIKFKAFNAPVQAGAAYLVNKNLQWFFGLRVDLRDEKLPIVPAIGVRWQFADQWTLNLMLPRPRVEFEVFKGLKLYVGGDVNGGSYYVKKNQGYIHGQVIGDEIVSTMDASAVGGAEWKVLPNVSLDASAGWLVLRQFYYQDTEKSVHSVNAPTLKLSVTAKF